MPKRRLRREIEPRTATRLSRYNQKPPRRTWILWDNRRRKAPWLGVSVLKTDAGMIMKPPIYTRPRRHILLGACLISALFVGQQTFAKQVDKQSDNSGRQIAAVIPGMPRPITITVPNMAPSQHYKSSTPLIQTHGRTTTITVPKSVEEAADMAWVASNKFAKASYQKVIVHINL